MSSFVEALHEWLCAEYPGHSIYLTQLPPEPPAAIALIPSGGMAVDRYLGIWQPTVQVLVRNPDGTEAFRVAEEVLRLLTNRGGFVVGGHLVDWVQALTYPLSVGTDQNGRFLVSCNFLLRVRPA